MLIVSTVSNLIGERSVKARSKVLDSAKDLDVKGFYFTTTGCCLMKRLIELIEVFGLDTDMKFTEIIGTETKLTAFQGVTNDHALLFEVSQEVFDGGSERKIFASVDEVDPNRVGIHDSVC
jgi:hypothetical protein